MHPDGPAYDGPLISAYFRHLAHRGCRVVRFWLFEFFEGLELEQSEDTARTKITGLATDFQAHVQDMAHRAEAAGIQIYWTLFDAARVNNQFVESPLQLADAQLFHRLLEEVDFQQQFLENALRPLAILLEQLPNSSFGIDLMNEPEGRNGSLLKPALARVPRRVAWRKVMRYLKAAKQTIRAAGCSLPISVGCRHYKTVCWHRRQLDAVVDFYDFHRYNRSGKLPNWRRRRFGDKDCLIGEFGSSEAHLGPAVQRTHTEALLQQLKIKGYAGALLWRYDYFEPNFSLLAFSGEAEGETRRFDAATFEAFRTSFLSGAGTEQPLLAMDDPAWRARHEPAVWQTIQQFSAPIA